MAAITTKASERAISRKVRKGHGVRSSQAPKRARKSDRREGSRGTSAKKRTHDIRDQRRTTDESNDMTGHWSATAPFYREDTSVDDTPWTPQKVAATHDGSDKASFLSKYFRDMSVLEVLRPEQEVIIARRIEDLEIAVWEQAFSYPPIIDHLIQVIGRNMEKPTGDFSELRVAAGESRRSNARSSRHELERVARDCGARLHSLDVDRIAAQAVVAEIERIRDGQPTTFEGFRLRFSPKSRLFTQYRERVRAADRTAAEARNDFVRANLRLVVSIARRFNHGRMSLADLIQEGNIGLMKAVERYDYRRGFRFSTYASWWIRHAISRALADKGREVRLPVHILDAHHKLTKARRELTAKLGRKPTNEELSTACDMPADKIEKMRGYLTDRSYSLDRPVNDDDGRSLIEFLDDPEYDESALTEGLNIHALARAMRGALQELKPIEADILKQRFGLDSYHEHTLKQIGEKYNLSRERIRQLQEQALDKVRALMLEQRLGM